MTTLTIATRTSPLALWQAHYVKQRLEQHHPDLHVAIHGVKTFADKFLELPLTKMGGKGVFVKELEHAILNCDADIAVHSLKDVPATFPEGLGLGAICERADPRDVWICPAKTSFDSLKAGANVGTSSLRRIVQLSRLRPDLNYVPLRGNVGTRLQRCLDGKWDAIVLAKAGIDRLGYASHILDTFSMEVVMPAVGQGALGIECRVDDVNTLEMLKTLDHTPTRQCIEAERAMNAALGGNCQVPVAGIATLEKGALHLRGRVGDPQKKVLLEASAVGKPLEAKALGASVAKQLIAQGAKEVIDNILKALGRDPS